MDTDHSNQDNDDQEHIHGIRKITYWEKYGVKRFSYRGKRKYTPLVYQPDEGGIIISNDVFGLTIRQFERMHKDCLCRRKTHENWIMNLRYPDKALNEYLEYLENCTDCNKEKLPFQITFTLYHNEIYYRIIFLHLHVKQLLFILHDTIYNANDESATQISSGSLAEGLDLPGSDVDIMFVHDAVYVTRIEKNIKHPVQRTEVFMETDTDHPGFTRLRLVAAGKREHIFVSKECIVNTQTSLHLSTTNFLKHMKQINTKTNYSTHGPCLSDKDQTIDIANCLKSKYLPYHVIPWILRYRLQLPPNAIIDRNFLVYVVCYGQNVKSLTQNYNVLTLIESLQNSKSSTFNIGAYKFHYASISQNATQLLSPPNTNYDIRTSYHRHLQNGIQMDAVTGWLLYASFYYVTAQYNETIELTEFVLPKCSPDMIGLGNHYSQTTTVKQI
ncbi:Hypothetical predicted protein [Mytilus galloprovincialis]|uniref:Uncharacterized protein n=1 Tax=Mytilus galloprovincialis TaxID=29158 RepID=A0A8B6FV74_MYTGA|nr:Hypothetical predicted protein [Mytilus galloprovincialis]